MPLILTPPAFTRSVRNLYLIEGNRTHRLFELLELRESKENVKIQSEKSDEKEWLAEAEKLELQGKYEQAQQIRDRLSGIEYLSPEAYADLQKAALDPSKTESEAKRDRKALFRYAEARKHIAIIEQLADLNFNRAQLYMKEVKAARADYEKACRLGRLFEIDKVTNKYSSDFRDEEGRTGLMIAVKYGNTETFKHFIEQKADISATDKDGRQAAHLAFWEAYSDALANKTDYARFFRNTYKILKTGTLRCVIGNKLVILNDQSMLFYLVNFFWAIEENYRQVKKSQIEAKLELKLPDDFPMENLAGLAMDSVMLFVEKMPGFILPPYRRKRQYVNSVLSGNEVDRDFIYNKKLFKRVDRGIYKLNPDLKIEFGK